MNDFALNLWLGSGIFLMATELLLPGLVMVFVGMGALTVAISMYFGYVDGYVHQLMIFFISSSIYLSTLRFLVLRFVPTDTQKENINEDDKVIGKRGDTVTVYSDQAPSDTVMGQDVFEVIHDKTKDVLLVTIEDIEEV